MESERKTTIIRVPKDKYLSDVIKGLPAGIFNKTKRCMCKSTVQKIIKYYMELELLVEPPKVSTRVRTLNKKKDSDNPKQL